MFLQTHVMFHGINFATNYVLKNFGGKKKARKGWWEVVWSSSGKFLKIIFFLVSLYLLFTIGVHTTHAEG